MPPIIMARRLFDTDVTLGDGLISVSNSAANMGRRLFDTDVTLGDGLISVSNSAANNNGATLV